MDGHISDLSPVTCMELDTAGQLLLSCRATGALGVHDVWTLRHQASMPAPPECVLLIAKFATVGVCFYAPFNYEGLRSACQPNY